MVGQHNQKIKYRWGEGGSGCVPLYCYFFFFPRSVSACVPEAFALSTSLFFSPEGEHKALVHLINFFLFGLFVLHLGLASCRGVSGRCRRTNFTFSAILRASPLLTHDGEVNDLWCYFTVVQCTKSRR